jgi:hypothetical protein
MHNNLKGAVADATEPTGRVIPVIIHPFLEPFAGRFFIAPCDAAQA